ncbi:hypothetical protein RGR602_PC00102 (plasmid) [Rhizobium gallicum bv. gallicum R602sp]|uniref:Uncharacterized protein n=1 Tax=Rhizobium gallicum bv. gallicum R602sp TaxID=1041138 RepID=A0A0B4X821_9HYPH|nr:hypothetical protein RGR602_PC00102 [Rhizobium gallicum bv. gallicum R602sp]
MVTKHYMRVPIDALVPESDIKRKCRFSDVQKFCKQGLSIGIKTVNLHLAGYAIL